MVATLLLLFAIAGAHGQRNANAGSDPLSLAAPPDEVKDPFIAMVIGLLAHDAFVALDGDTLPRLFPELAEIADIPFQSLHSFSRVPLGGSRARRFEVRFGEDLEIPLPINILGYRPGRVRLARTITGDQRVLRRLTLSHPENQRLAVIGPVYVVDLQEGGMQIELDWWLDLLLGRDFGDLDARLVLIFRYRGTCFGVLGGYTRGDRVLSWTFDLEHSYFLVRPPSMLRGLAELFL